MKVDKKYLKQCVKKILSSIEKDESLLVDMVGKLETISLLYKQNRVFRNLLLNPSLSIEEKIKVLEKVSSTLDINKQVFLVLAEAVKDNKSAIIADIGKAFRFEVEKFFATIKGEVVVAHPIDEELLSKIKAVVESKLGRKVELSVKEDPSLIAGAVIKAGSYVIDSSIKTYLKNLEKELSRF